MPSAIDETVEREKKFERARVIGEKYAAKFAGTKTKYLPPLSGNYESASWIPDPKEPSSPIFSAVGLRWRKHELVLDRWKPPSKSKPAVIEKAMRTKYAACAALGLSYWCDGFRGEVVTVDRYQRFVAIYIDLKRSEVRLVGTTRSVKFTTADNDATLDLLANDQPTGPVGSTHSATEPEPEKPTAIDRLTAQRAIAHIRHDGSYVTDTETAVLQHIAAKAKYYNGGRDIVALVTAELERRAAA